MRSKRRLRGALAFLTASVLSLMALGGCSGTGSDTAKESKKEAETGGVQNNETGTVQNTGDSSSAMGRYMESEINLPEGMALVNSTRILSDGRIRLLGMSEDALGVWESADWGVTWSQPYTWPEELSGENIVINCGAIADDGSVFCSVCDMEGETVYVKFDSDGQYTQITPLLPESTEDLEGIPDSIYWIRYAEAGKWLVQRIADSRIFLIDDTNGEVLRTYNEDEDDLNYWWKTGDIILTFGYDDVRGYDYETGKERELDEVFREELESNKENLNMTDTMSYPLAACEGEEGVFYYCNADGIYRYAQGGSMIEQIADGKLNSLSKPSLCLTDIQVAADGAVLLSAMDESAPKLLCYRYDESVPSVPDAQLKIYALEENAELQQAISMFQTEYPQYYVNLEIGLTGEDAVTASDALRTLNTEIMAGNGPDILILDGMPVDSYMEKGILEDISSIVKQVEADDGLFAQIAETYEKDGTILAVPTRFQVPILQADTALLDTINSLPELAAAAEELRQEDGDIEQIDNIPTLGALLNKLYTAYSRELLREDGSIDTEKMTEFISSAKQLFELNHYDEDRKESYFSTGGIEGYDMTTYSGSMDFIAKRCKFSHSNIASAEALAQICSVNELENMAYKLMPAGEQRIFVPKIVAGINSKSNQKDGAKEFVSFLLSEKAQKTNQGIGLPVNRAAFGENLEDAQSMESYFSTSMVNEDGIIEEYALDVKQPPLEERERFTQLVESLDTPCLTDAVMQELVTEQAGMCLKGEVSVEEAVSTIEQKMNLYLAE